MSFSADPQFVLIVGDDLETNIITIGPFETTEDATKYADVECRGEEWHVATLYPVRH